jgi:hypothetical protein
MANIWAELKVQDLISNHLSGCLSGIMVSALAMDPVFTAIKICSTPSFRDEVKLDVKELYERNIL